MAEDSHLTDNEIESLSFVKYKTVTSEICFNNRNHLHISQEWYSHNSK
jgi:hypothetical protein